MDEAKQISVVVGMDEDGNVKKAFASHDATLIIATSQRVRECYDNFVLFTCELIDTAPIIRKSRAKESSEGQ